MTAISGDETIAAAIGGGGSVLDSVNRGAGNGTINVLPSAIITATGEIGSSPVSMDPPTTVIPGDTLTEVLASADVSYVIIIPELVDFGTLSRYMPEKTLDFNVRIIDALLESDSSVTVNVNSGFKMTQTTGSATINYRLFSGDTLVSDNETYCVFRSNDLLPSAAEGFNATAVGAVKITPSELTRAGDYRDTMVFTCIYNAA